MILYRCLLVCRCMCLLVTGKKICQMHSAVNGFLCFLVQLLRQPIPAAGYTWHSNASAYAHNLFFFCPDLYSVVSLSGVTQVNLYIQICCFVTVTFCASVCDTDPCRLMTGCCKVTVTSETRDQRSCLQCSPSCLGLSVRCSLGDCQFQMWVTELACD